MSVEKTRKSRMLNRAAENGREDEVKALLETRDEVNVNWALVSHKASKLLANGSLYNWFFLSCAFGTNDTPTSSTRLHFWTSLAPAGNVSLSNSLQLKFYRETVLERKLVDWIARSQCSCKV